MVYFKSKLMQPNMIRLIEQTNANARKIMTCLGYVLLDLEESINITCTCVYQESEYREYPRHYNYIL